MIPTLKGNECITESVGSYARAERTGEKTTMAAAIPPIARTTDRSGMCRVNTLPELGQDHPRRWRRWSHGRKMVGQSRHLASAHRAGRAGMAHARRMARARRMAHAGVVSRHSKAETAPRAHRRHGTLALALGLVFTAAGCTAAAPEPARQTPPRLPHRPVRVPQLRRSLRRATRRASRRDSRRRGRSSSPRARRS